MTQFEILGSSKFDELVKSPKALFSVIPAKAGIQLFQDVLDPGFRRGDDAEVFLRDHQVWAVRTSNLLSDSILGIIGTHDHERDD
jgi:hypothetical protein